MKSKTLAIAGSIAALSLTAAPIAAASSTSHHAKPPAHADRSLDLRGARHVDKSPDRADKADRSSPDLSRDYGDR